VLAMSVDEAAIFRSAPSTHHALRLLQDVAWVI